MKTYIPSCETKTATKLLSNMRRMGQETYVNYNYCSFNFILQILKPCLASHEQLRGLQT